MSERMGGRQTELPRWKEHGDQLNLAERAAGEAIRAMRTPEPLTGPQLARIAAHVRSSSRPNRSRMWTVVAAAFVLGVATAASAARLSFVPHWMVHLVSPRPVVMVPHAAPSIGVRKQRQESSPESVPVPLVQTSIPKRPAPEASQPKDKTASPAPASTAVPKAITSSHRSRAGTEKTPPLTTAELRSPSPSSVFPPGQNTPTPAQPEARQLSPSAAAKADGTLAAGTSPSNVVRSPQVERQLAWVDSSPQGKPAPEAGKADEPRASNPSNQDKARYLTDAIRLLRVDHSPESALLVLDRNATTLEKSPYGHEALLVRIEALLALGRQAEVLRLLDGTPLVDVAASHVLLVTRGRLRAAANRCAEGVGDFDLVLMQARHTDKQALYGRALCRNKLGDGSGARADLERYRHEFPNDAQLRDLERQVGSR